MPITEINGKWDKKKYKMYSLKRKKNKKVNVEVTACVEIDKRLRGS